MKYKAGAYLKAVGGDFGVYYDGKKWVSFQCLGCVIAKGLVIPAERLNNGSHPALNKKIGYKFVELHDKAVHNEWLKNGKPYKK